MRKLIFLSLGLIVLCHQLIAQSRTITGKVTDEKGIGIANTSVIIKGTATGTTTNADGSFSISIPANARTLIISYVGMGEREINLASNSTYNVTLSPTATNDLEEIVVTGYGTPQRRRNSTASITTVGAKELENRPFTSVDKMLQGKVPGLIAPQQSGQPGSNQQFFAIVLRKILVFYFKQSLVVSFSARYFFI